MLLLTQTSDLVRIVTGAASQIEVHAAYVDLTTSTGDATPGRTNTAITTATTTTVVASPASGVVRNVRSLYITNNHATASTQVEVSHTDGTTAVEIIGVTLLPGENLAYREDGSWVHRDTQGGEYTYQVPAQANMGATGTLAETCPRYIAGTSSTAGTSGTLYLSAIYLTAGQIISNITIASGATAFTTPTNCFFALYSSLPSAPALLAQSANQTTTAWAANQIKTLAMTTPYRVPTSGIYYIGVMVTATTMGTFNGPPALTNTAQAGAAPILFAASSTGLTTALPNPAAAISLNATAARFYAAVS